MSRMAGNGAKHSIPKPGCFIHNFCYTSRVDITSNNFFVPKRMNVKMFIVEQRVQIILPEYALMTDVSTY